jgi:hypothetical protein
MNAIVRTTIWALVGGLWGAALATKGSIDVSTHAALLGVAIGVVAGAVLGVAMHALMRWIRNRRSSRSPDA